LPASGWISAGTFGGSTGKDVAVAVDARAPETTRVASAMGRRVLTIGEVRDSLTPRK
jgi:hypothetical protein